MAKKKEYQVQAETSVIKFTSRCAIKVKDNYYTIEASEERNVFPDMEGIDMSKEWQALCDTVNAIVDNQCEEIMQTFKK
jgi:hypothetical protein